MGSVAVEREQPVEQQREKAKTKSRKLHPDFNIEDFLKFYGLEVDNVANNDYWEVLSADYMPHQR